MVPGGDGLGLRYNCLRSKARLATGAFQTQLVARLTADGVGLPSLAPEREISGSTGFLFRFGLSKLCSVRPVHLLYCSI